MDTNTYEGRAAIRAADGADWKRGYSDARADRKPEAGWSVAYGRGYVIGSSIRIALRHQDDPGLQTVNVPADYINPWKVAA